MQGCTLPEVGLQREVGCAIGVKDGGQMTLRSQIAITTMSQLHGVYNQLSTCEQTTTVCTATDTNRKTAAAVNVPQHKIDAKLRVTTLIMQSRCARRRLFDAIACSRVKLTRGGADGAGSRPQLTAPHPAFPHNRYGAQRVLTAPSREAPTAAAHTALFIFALRVAC